MSESRDAQTQYSHVQPGIVLFARCRQQPFYVARIITVDRIRQRCYMRFEDDTMHWCRFEDLQKKIVSDDGCCLCNDGPSRILERIVCSECHLGFHRTCHNPAVSDQSTNTWKCNVCVYAITGCKSEIFFKSLTRIRRRRGAGGEDASDQQPQQGEKKRRKRSPNKPKNRPTGKTQRNTVDNSSSSSKRIRLDNNDQPDHHSQDQQISAADNHCSSMPDNSCPLLAAADLEHLSNDACSQQSWSSTNVTGSMPCDLPDDDLSLNDYDGGSSCHDRPFTADSDQEYESDASSNFKERFINSFSVEQPALPAQAIQGSGRKTGRDGKARTVARHISIAATVSHGTEINNELGLCDFNVESVICDTDFTGSAVMPSRGTVRVAMQKDLNSVMKQEGVEDEDEEPESAADKLPSVCDNIEDTSVLPLRITRDRSLPSIRTNNNNSTTITSSSLQRSASATNAKISEGASMSLEKNRKQTVYQCETTANVASNVEFSGLDIINSLTHPKNVVEKSRIDATCHKKVSMSRLKMSMCDYFGTMSRLTNGVRCRIIGRRVTDAGIVQYLVEWDGGIVV